MGKKPLSYLRLLLWNFSYCKFWFRYYLTINLNVIAPSNFSKTYFWHKNQNSSVYDQKYFIWVFWVAVLKTYCHIWSQPPWICLIAKFSAKQKILKFWSKKVWFSYFWTRIWKNCFNVWNQGPRICLTKILHAKVKTPYLENLGLEHEKVVVIFEINTLKLFWKESVAQTWKSLNLGPKCLVWIFSAAMLKKYCHIWI